MTDERLLALAERCEKATGPDHNLDIDIALAVDRAEWRNGILYGGQPLLTASLDEAMTLVPEGVQWMLTTDGPRYLAHVRGFTASAATPALALTAARLRARAMGTRDEV